MQTLDNVKTRCLLELQDCLRKYLKREVGAALVKERVEDVREAREVREGNEGGCGARAVEY